MKRFLNIFYTTQSKALFIVLLIVCSWLMNTEFTEMLSIYRQDRAALINVFIQGNNFDFDSSYLLKNSVERAIEDVLEYTLVYNRKANIPYTKYDTFATEDYDALVDHLKALKNLKYAVVNHKTDIIVSNIPDLNGVSSGMPIKGFFTEEENLLIIRNAKSPIFSSDTMNEYAEYVSNTAKKYPDDFDLYMSFDDTMEFAGTREDFSQKHNKTLSAVNRIYKSSITYLVVIFIIFVSLVTVSGKREIGGKTYPSLTDKLLNDVKFLLHIIVYLSMSALYENSLYMALRITREEDYWFNFSADYYLFRSNLSMIVMVCIITAFVCTIKRQLRLGTLVSNTYIYKLVKNFKKAEPEK